MQNFERAHRVSLIIQLLKPEPECACWPHAVREAEEQLRQLCAKIEATQTAFTAESHKMQRDYVRHDLLRNLLVDYRGDRKWLRERILQLGACTAGGISRWTREQHGDQKLAYTWYTHHLRNACRLPSRGSSHCRTTHIVHLFTAQMAHGGKSRTYAYDCCSPCMCMEDDFSSLQLLSVWSCPVLLCLCSSGYGPCSHHIRMAWFSALKVLSFPTLARSACMASFAKQSVSRSVEVWPE